MERIWGNWEEMEKEWRNGAHSSRIVTVFIHFQVLRTSFGHVFWTVRDGYWVCWGPSKHNTKKKGTILKNLCIGFQECRLCWTGHKMILPEGFCESTQTLLTANTGFNLSWLQRLLHNYPTPRIAFVFSLFCSSYCYRKYCIVYSQCVEDAAIIIICVQCVHHHDGDHHYRVRCDHHLDKKQEVFLFCNLRHPCFSVSDC